MDQGKRLRRDENALNRSRNGFGKVLGQRRLKRRTSAGFPEDPPPPLAGSEPRGASSEAELAAHVIPGHCCARVGEMGRPAPIQLSAEDRIDRQRPISGLVIEAVPEGDRQSKPFVPGQLKKVRHGCHRHQERLRTQRRHSPWWSRGWEGSRPRQQGFSPTGATPCHTPRPSKPARTRNPGQDPRSDGVAVARYHDPCEPGRWCSVPSYRGTADGSRVVEQPQSPVSAGCLIPPRA